MTLRDLRKVFDDETTFYLCKKRYDNDGMEYIEQIAITNYLWGCEDIWNMSVDMKTVKAARFQVHIYTTMPLIVWEAWKKYAEHGESLYSNEEV